MRGAAESALEQRFFDTTRLAGEVSKTKERAQRWHTSRAKQEFASIVTVSHHRLSLRWIESAGSVDLKAAKRAQNKLNRRKHVIIAASACRQL